MGQTNTKNCNRKPRKRVRDNSNDTNEEPPSKHQRLHGTTIGGIKSRATEEIPVIGREPPIHSPTYSTRDHTSHQPAWSAYIQCNAQQPKNGITSPEVPSIIVGRWSQAQRKLRSDIGKTHNHKGVRRRVVRRGESEIPVWKLGNIERASNHMDLPKTRHCCPIDNRSGVYRILRDGKRPPVDNPVFRRGVGAYIGPNIVWGQRGSNKNDKDTIFPSTNPPYRAPTPLYSGASGSETNYNQGNQGQGQSSRSPNEVITHDDSEELDEGEFQRLMDEWLQ